MKAKLVKLVSRLKAYFPEVLPTGVSEFNAWADSFFDIYSFPTDDKDSIKFALCTMIMHLGPQAYKKSKHHFYISIMAGAAKQVAGAVFHEIKYRQQEAAAKAAEAANEEQKG